MPITVDELMESAASGVLRALNARSNGEAGRAALVDARSLVASGFNVEFNIRCGGRLADAVDLNPQPLPPVASGGIQQF